MKMVIISHRDGRQLLLPLDKISCIEVSADGKEFTLFSMDSKTARTLAFEDKESADAWLATIAEEG